MCYIDTTAETEGIATDIGFDHGWRHAAYVNAYGGDPNAEPAVPPWFATVATFYTAAYADGVTAYLDDTDDDTATGQFDR